MKNHGMSYGPRNKVILHTEILNQTTTGVYLFLTNIHDMVNDFAAKSTTACNTNSSYHSFF